MKDSGEKQKQLLPLFGVAVQCGFPSPAEDYIESSIDLNHYLVDHPASTFFLRAEGYSMIEAQIYPGDLLVVDRAVEPSQNSIILAYIDGKYTVKQFVKKDNDIYLMPCNKDYSPILVEKDSDFLIWGVVVYVIHKLS